MIGIPHARGPTLGCVIQTTGRTGEGYGATEISAGTHYRAGPFGERLADAHDDHDKQPAAAANAASNAAMPGPPMAWNLDRGAIGSRAQEQWVRTAVGGVDLISIAS